MNKRKLSQKPKKVVTENIDSGDVQEIRDMIRMEIASIFFDLFKKRKAWM